MGLRNWVHNRRMSDPVTGTYRLTSCSRNSGGSVYENCHMNGVLTAPGITAVAVAHYCTAPTRRWPQPGLVLPVTVDRADPTRMRVDWDRVPKGRDRGMQLAEQLAAAMGGATTGTTTSTTTVYSVVGAPGRPMPGGVGGGLSPAQAAAAAGDPAMRPATARVLAVHEVAVPAGMSGGGAAGTVDITLDVSAGAGDGWTATTRIAFSTPEKRARVATVGAELPVLVNPDAHDQIAIDTSRLT